MKKILVTRKLLQSNEERLKTLYDVKLNSNDELYSQKKLIELGKSFQSVLFERLSGQIVLFIVFLTSLTFYFLYYGKYTAFLYLFLLMISIVIISRLILRKLNL